MINIQRKEDCCGCSACAQCCPTQCIKMEADKEGFLYPKVDSEKCINCNLCTKICPVINPQNIRTPIESFGAYIIDKEIRLQSSSGSIFSIIAKKIIDEEGIIFGATYNNEWEVVHRYINNAEELPLLRGSKYVQSNIGECFKLAKSFLQRNLKVLFSGTPCQIAGLKHYLKKDYPNLITVDFICHGVPSPLIWKLYLQETLQTYNKKAKETATIKSINFRDKCEGWKDFHFTINLNNGRALSYQPWNNLYMRAFLCNLILRPSCYHCPSKSGKSGSDITIADFWQVENLLPNYNDNQGVNAVLINTTKGKELFSKLSCVKEIVNYKDIIMYNKSYYKDYPIHPDREKFFTNLDSNKSICKQLNKTLSTSIIKKILCRFTRLMH